MGCCVSQNQMRVNPSGDKQNKQTVNTCSELSERTVKDDEKKSRKTEKCAEQSSQTKQVNIETRKQSYEGQIIVKDHPGTVLDD